MVKSYKRHPLSLRFHQLLKEMGDLHDKKQQDYGSDDDPFKNINAARDWGVKPYIAAFMRLGEKVERLKNLIKKGRLANESAEDSMNDIAVYAMIARILYEADSRPVQPAVIGEYRNYFSLSDPEIHEAIETFEKRKHERRSHKPASKAQRNRSRRHQAR